MTATSSTASVPNGLQAQIDTKRREIQTEGYPMSVGELTNLYRDDELDIHPEFQRFFRWSPRQKSRFIESLLLGIPIPSIFVYQRQDGVWDVIDGVQRLSTIFEFQGLLKDEDGKAVAPSVLSGTEYLPALEGLAWGSDEGDALSPEQQRLIKRSAIDVKIVRRESDEGTKFDLFQRLNTGGSQLSDQEVRNCLLIMAEPEYYRWVLELSRLPSFQDSIAVSDRAAGEQYDLELVLRFLLLRHVAGGSLRGVGDMSDFLDTESIAQAKAWPGTHEAEAEHFKELFDLIYEAMGDQAFRRYDSAKQRFMGGFSVSAFETVTTGVSANLADWQKLDIKDRDERLRARIGEIWSHTEFRDNSGSGIRASTRLPKTIPFARSFVRP